MNISIVVMDEHFLYLPLYFAKRNNFFGFVPPQYNIEIGPSDDKTDTSAFEMLMDTSSNKNKSVQFAVCDPARAMLYPDTSGSTPAILAALINNTAFWAIDRRSRHISQIQHLAAFDTIIAFDPGTTSYGIASRIWKDAGKADTSIKRVKPKQELVALQQSKRDTIALSPDILGIDHLLSYKGEFNIDLAVGTTPEYNNVLITALISRRDFVDRHSELVVGILKAIQRALLFVRIESPDVIAYAAERFGHTSERVISALRRADESNAFPPTIEVSEAHWINAAHVAADAHGATWDEAAQTAARACYKQIVEPYAFVTRTAARDKEIYATLIAPVQVESVWKRLITPILNVLFWTGAAGAVGHWCHWSALLVLALGGVLGFVLSAWMRLRAWTTASFLHWFCWLGIVGVACCWLAPSFRASATKYVPLTAGLTLTLAEIKLIHDERKKHSSGR